MFIQNKGLDLKHNNLFASSKISIIVSDWNNEITESLSGHSDVLGGVLTTNNKKQAFERSGGKFGNKGEESSIALLKTLKIIQETNSK